MDSAHNREIESNRFFENLFDNKVKTGVRVLFPYRFFDPDGRCTGSRIENDDGTCKSTGGATTESTSAHSDGKSGTDPSGSGPSPIELQVQVLYLRAVTRHRARQTHMSMN